MSRPPSPPHLLAGVALGDIVILPDGSARTARCRGELPAPQGSVGGFLIVGEMELLLTVPTGSSGPVDVYVPLGYVPDRLHSAELVAEGAARYWAPHLPGVSAAMGELLYRVVRAPGSIDLSFLVYRGAELVVYTRSTFAWSRDISVEFLPRSDRSEGEVQRFASTVRPAPSVPQPVAPQEERQPARTLFDTFARSV